jgi:hypothetical protein
MSHYLNGQKNSVLQALQTLIQHTGLLQGLLIKEIMTPTCPKTAPDVHLNMDLGVIFYATKFCIH